VPDLEALGLDVEALAGLKKGLQQSSGIVLVAGPTGSGKSTSLAAMLKSLQGAQLAILSLENPIEYQMDWVIQTEVREGLGLGFAEGVRAMMRLDPDVVMIGEIRDAKTALTALQAARTGHLVLASVHASSFGQMKRRMVDLGVGEGELEGVLVGAFIQRLVRKRCPVCEGVGCAQCSQTGYAGRRPLIEVWSARGVCAQSFEQLCQQALEAGWLDEAERLRVFGARAGE
jgi:type II secretory ATPase GspE/PulE/Tfp pilus assembly ATPase PilB-like protein